MIDFLLQSNLFGVCIGGFVTLMSIYSVEYFKYLKEKQTDKVNIYHQIVAQLNLF